MVDASLAVLWLPTLSRNAPNIYWAPFSRCPHGENIKTYSTGDKPELVYEAFNTGGDFTPRDIARTLMYCHWVDALCVKHTECAGLVHLSSDWSPKERANSVTLCCAYLILARGASVEAAYAPFIGEDLAAIVLDVLQGLVRAVGMGWLNYQAFPAPVQLPPVPRRPKAPPPPPPPPPPFPPYTVLSLIHI